MCTPPLPYNRECVTDDDCVLMDTSLGWGCCYAGAGGIIDYRE